MGSSISVNGVCLTITAHDTTALSFDVMPETWHKTTLGSLHTGAHVNLERAVRADGRFDGHFVQGHVEGVGEVVHLEDGGGDYEIEISLPKHLLPFVIPKGSIAVDGVSLTIAAIAKETCILALIPTTLRETILGTLRIGDHVNIETDLLVRTITNLLPRP